jgi:hypothetical protein
MKVTTITDKVIITMSIVVVHYQLSIIDCFLVAPGG